MMEPETENKIVETLEEARFLGKNITDFFPTFDEFKQQYMLYKFRQFVWQKMWTSGKFAKWTEIDEEWLSVREEHKNELEWFWYDSRTLQPQTPSDMVVTYMTQNPYVSVAYENLKEWLHVEGYKTRS